MFLRRHRKQVEDVSYEYWTLCESVRTAAGPRQRVVATLGKLTGEDPEAEAGWEDLQSLLEGKTMARQLMLGEKEPAKEETRAKEKVERWETVDVSAVRVERVRDFGEAWLGLSLWHRLGLHTLLGSLIEPGKEDVPWQDVAAVLCTARFCAQRSELGFAEHWYERTALEDITGIPLAKINDDRLCRGLDVLAAHALRISSPLDKGLAHRTTARRLLASDQLHGKGPGPTRDRIEIVVQKTRATRGPRRMGPPKITSRTAELGLVPLSLCRSVPL